MPRNIISFIIPQTVETRTSHINGTITVQKLLGKYSIIAGGLTQSGGLVKDIWKKVTRHLAKRHFNCHPPQQILILGLGSGSLVKDLVSAWPQAHITGIELDPVMVELGRHYFNLDSFPCLTIHQTDAIAWIDRPLPKFDLIYIDLYLGRLIPQEADKTDFYRSVKKRLKPNGLAVINRLTLAGQKPHTKKTRQKLASVFTKVYRIPTPVNLMLACTP